MEALARRTMRQASGYAWMYERMAASSKRWGDGLNIVSGVLGALVGTAGIVSIFTDSSTPLWSRIVAAVLGFLIAVVSALTATWKPSEAQMDNVLTQVSYATMERDLMYQLAQPCGDRADAQEYMQRVLSGIEQLKVSAPIISGITRAAYNRKFQNNPIYSPEDSWDATVADAQAARDALERRAPRGYDDAFDMSDAGREPDSGSGSGDAFDTSGAGREPDSGENDARREEASDARREEASGLGDGWESYSGPPVAPRGAAGQPPGAAAAPAPAAAPGLLPASAAGQR